MWDKLSVSKYPKAYSKNSNTVLLLDELQKIQNGFYKSPIEDARKALIQNDLIAYKNFKSELPAVTFCGIFSGAHRRENLTAYNKIVVIDIDNLDVNVLQEVKQKLSTDKFVFSCWKSPSDKGLKLLIKAAITEDAHKFIFDQISKYLFEIYNIEVDKSGSDVCRLCYVSYDPDIYINLQSEIFELSIDVAVEQKQEDLIKRRLSKPQKIKAAIATLTENEKALFAKTEGRNERNNREQISTIIKFLSKNGKSITSSYQNWVQVGFAISNSFTYDLGKKYFIALCELDGANHSDYKSNSLLEYCYRNRRIGEVNFGSIVHLAKEKGFISKAQNKNRDTSKVVSPVNRK